jgi:hypothetical protein
MDSGKILNSIVWKTTEPVSSARINGRPLTQEEWETKLVSRKLNSDFQEGYFILWHPASAVNAAKYVVPQCCPMVIDETCVRDVLQAVSRLTIKTGPRKILDSVHFEGASIRKRGVLNISIGS